MTEWHMESMREAVASIIFRVKLLYLFSKYFSYRINCKNTALCILVRKNITNGQGKYEQRNLIAFIVSLSLYIAIDPESNSPCEFRQLVWIHQSIEKYIICTNFAYQNFVRLYSLWLFQRDDTFDDSFLIQWNLYDIIELNQFNHEGIIQNSSKIGWITKRKNDVPLITLLFHSIFQIKLLWIKFNCILFIKSFWNGSTFRMKESVLSNYTW